MRRMCKRIYCFLLALCISLLLFNGASAEASGRMLVPGGNVVGIKVECDGVLVIGMNETENGGAPAFAAGVRTGDIITHVGAQKVAGISEFRDALGSWNGSEISLRVLRGDKRMQFSVTPQAGENGAELGLWLRDGMAGIGTISYYDPVDGSYGALGHAVNDVDTGVLLPVKSGSIMRAEVSGMIRGESGKPGELLGSVKQDEKLGSIEINCNSGIFGKAYDLGGLALVEPIETAEREEIHTGAASIFACIDGNVEEYSIEISRIYPEDSAGRDLLLSICDSRLIEKTGGIVQGMSGSPIIQNGKLIGAVTHVLINDPTKGYGIFIENMLDAAG